jgi:hypothetical protein
VESFRKNKKLHLRLQPVPIQTAGTVTLKVDSFAFIVYRRQEYPIDVELPSVDQSGTAKWQTVAELGAQ